MVPLTALAPPGKGGGEGVARGGKGKGSRIHSRTDGGGMPLVKRPRRPRAMSGPRWGPCWRGASSARANGAARANGVKSLPWIRAMMRKPCGSICVSVGAERSSRSGCGRPRKTGADRSQKWSHGSKPSGLAWFQKQYRRLVVRWERLVACFEAFLAVATIHIWIHRFIVGQIHVSQCRCGRITGNISSDFRMKSKPRFQLSLVPAIVNEPRLRTVFLCGVSYRSKQSLEVTNKFFKLIFFMESRKKNNATLLRHV